MDDLLLPRIPDDTHTLFDLPLGDLTEKLDVRPEVFRLALLAVRHLLGNVMLRLPFMGPPASERLSWPGSWPRR